MADGLHPAWLGHMVWADIMIYTFKQVCGWGTLWYVAPLSKQAEAQQAGKVGRMPDRGEGQPREEDQGRVPGRGRG